MRIRALLALAAGGSLMAGCAATAANTNSASSAPPIKASKSDVPAFPSTYKAYPSVPTAITGVTIFDGEGRRIDTGTVFMAGGKITSVGGPDTVIPKSGRNIVSGRRTPVFRGHWLTAALPRCKFFPVRRTSSEGGRSR